MSTYVMREAWCNAVVLRCRWLSGGVGGACVGGGYEPQLPKAQDHEQQEQQEQQATATSTKKRPVSLCLCGWSLYCVSE